MSYSESKCNSQRSDIGDLSGTFLEPPEGLDSDCLLFLGDPEMKTVSLFQRWWMPVAAPVTLVGASVFLNKAAKMPLRAAFHRHIFNAIFGVLLGEGGWRIKQRYDSEKDLQYYHYMITHPDEFKAPERKKWGDVLQPWTPFR